jgi:hypothetical protein
MVGSTVLLPGGAGGDTAGADCVAGGVCAEAVRQQSASTMAEPARYRLRRVAALNARLGDIAVGTPAVARHRERSLPAHPDKDDWFVYRQYTPTDVLACDHG